MAEGAPQDSSDQIIEPRLLTPEQARAGYTLAANESILVNVADVNTDGVRGEVVDTEDGRKVWTTPVGHLHLKGDRDSVIGYFLQTVEVTSEGDTHEGVMFAVNSRQSLMLPLSAAEPWGIGRKFEGQSEMRGGVSGDHCEVGLDEDGANLLVKNKDPKNGTAIVLYA